MITALYLGVGKKLATTELFNLVLNIWALHPPAYDSEYKKIEDLRKKLNDKFKKIKNFYPKLNITIINNRKV